MVLNSSFLKLNKIPVLLDLASVLFYDSFGMYSAFIVGDQVVGFGLFPFHLILFVGFGYVFF